MTAPGARERAIGGWWWFLRGAASIALAAVLLGVVLPRVTGTRWSEISGVVGRLDAVDVAVLSAVWVFGIWLYAFTIKASLPGLTHAQAMTVNVTTSAVSNLVPFGGALGLAATFAICRTWGFTPGPVALSALVTGIWNVLSKLALPMAGLMALAVSPGGGTGGLARPAAVGAAVLAVILVVLIGTLASEPLAVRTGRVAEAVGRAWLRIVRSPRRITWDEAVPRWRNEVNGLVAGGWLTLSAGLFGFLASQAFLLYLILGMLGSTLGPAEVFAGFAFSRLLTTIVLTPGGTGFTEAGTAALLVALGGEPAVCASGVLLFSGFVVFLEIPVGAVGSLVWLMRRSWRRPVNHQAGPTADATADPGADQPSTSSVKSAPASRGETTS
ncbi:MAG: putative heme transporter [Actinomycetota bacterium]|nr:putative heme transporter [Actinomycetota bacterium]